MTKHSYSEYRFALPRLRERRQELELSLQEIAAAIDFDFSTLAGIERRRNRCRADVRHRLSVSLKLPESELFEAEPIPPRGQQAHIRTRAELMANLGGCGSPTCQDSACELGKGSCHRPGCPHPAIVRRMTSAGRRWVKGEPSLFCSNECRLATPTARTGLVAASELAKDVDRARRSVTRYGRELVADRVLGRQLPGFRGRSGGLWFFTEEEAQKIRDHMATTPKSRLHNDPEFRADWYLARHKSTKGYGKAAKAIAQKRGKVVGRKTTLDKERVRQLIAAGNSQETVARMLGISRGSVRNALKKSG